MPHRRKSLEILLALAIVFAGSILPIRSHDPLGRALLDALHVPAFALFAAFLALRIFPGRGLRGILLALLLCALVSVASEAVQRWGPREPSPSDLLHDLLACGAALSWLHATRTRRARRAALRIASLVLIGIALSPLATAVADQRARRSAFPQLLEPGAGWSARVLAFRDASLVDNRAAALRVRYEAVTDAAIMLRVVEGDWREFRNLHLRLRSDAALALQLRIDDRTHDGRYRDRYEGEFALEAGENTLDVALEEIANSPQTRRMDLARMRSITLYLHTPERAHELELLELRLQRGIELSDRSAP